MNSWGCSQCGQTLVHLHIISCTCMLRRFTSNRAMKSLCRLTSVAKIMSSINETTSCLYQRVSMTVYNVHHNHKQTYLSFNGKWSIRWVSVRIAFASWQWCLSKRLLAYRIMWSTPDIIEIVSHIIYPMYWCKITWSIEQETLVDT